MNKNIRKMIALFSLVVLLASMIVVPNEVSAANDFYGDYTNVAMVYDYNGCPSIQGIAVGSQMIYTVKIGGDDTKAFITMSDKDTGETTRLINSATGGYNFDYFNHANDMDVWGIDGKSNLFVATTLQGANGIVRLRRDGDTLTKVATYRLRCNGEDICATAMGITGVSDGKIGFITKWGMQLYTGSVDVNATNATIEMTEFCSITKSRVYIKGEYLDLSNFVNQGMGYHDGTLFVPISGDDSQLNRSVIMVFDLNNATPGSTVYPTEALVFRVTSGAYSALFELESCDICSGDNKLYFGVQRRVTNSDTDHDGIGVFDTYTYSRLPVDAPTSEPSTQTYTVRYNANGGTGSSMADTVVTYGVSTKLRTNTYTRNGWDFAGWHAYRTSDNKWYYTNGSSYGWYVEGSQPSGYYKDTYADGVSVAKTSSVNKDLIIMYAQWTAKDITYTVRYNANGGTGTMDETVVVYGYSTPLRLNTFTRSGYKFVGWTAYRTAKNQWYYTDGTDTSWYTEGSQPSGWTKTVYKDGVSVAATTSTANDVVILYAQWESSGFTVTFKNADGTVLQSSVVDAGTVPAAPANPTKAYDSSKHYTFAGWDKTLTAVTADTTYTATYTGTAHSYTTKINKNATCTATGSKTLTCSCGYSYSETIPATGHSYSSVVTKPTCSAGGYTTYTCTACGDSYTGDNTAPSNHSYKTTVVEPTCTTGGYTSHRCTVCGDTYQSNTTAASGHNYSTVVTAPTCTEQGYTTYTCKDCGSSYKGDYVNAAGHQYTAQVTKPTCTAGGYTTYICSCGHSYQDNLTNPAGHSYKTVTVDATCTKDGSVTKTCQVCGDEQFTVIPSNGHSYSSVVTPPTCEDVGYTTYTCSQCGHYYKNNLVNPTLHSYKAVVTAPTCTAGGYTTYTCSACGDSYVSNAVNALGHSYVNGICGTCGAADPDYVDPVVQPTLKLKAPTLEFKEMVKIVVFYTAENLDDVLEMGMLTYTSAETVADIATADHVIPGYDYDSASGRYLSNSQGINAKYLGDELYMAIYAKLSDGSYVYTKVVSYSPKTYAMNQLEKSTDVKVKQLVAAMLNYGAAAQLYFQHNTDALANSEMTDEQKALPEAYRADMIAAVPSADAAKQGIFASNKGFSSRRPAVSFEGAFSVNYFFTPKYAPVDGITLYYWNEADFNAADVLTTENATGSVVMDGEGVGQYRGDVEGIAAKAISNAVYVAAIYSDGTTTWTSGVLGYSIGTYCSAQAANGGTIGDLAMATAVYGYHAKAYFG